MKYLRTIVNAYADHADFNESGAQAMAVLSGVSDNTIRQFGLSVRDVAPATKLVDGALVSVPGRLCRVQAGAVEFHPEHFAPLGMTTQDLFDVFGACTVGPGYVQCFDHSGTAARGDFFSRGYIPWSSGRYALDLRSMAEAFILQCDNSTILKVTEGSALVTVVGCSARLKERLQQLSSALPSNMLVLSEKGAALEVEFKSVDCDALDRTFTKNAGLSYRIGSSLPFPRGPLPKQADYPNAVAPQAKDVVYGPVTHLNPTAQAKALAAAFRSEVVGTWEMQVEVEGTRVHEALKMQPVACVVPLGNRVTFVFHKSHSEYDDQKYASYFIDPLQFLSNEDIDAEASRSQYRIDELESETGRQIHSYWRSLGAQGFYGPTFGPQALHPFIDEPRVLALNAHFGFGCVSFRAAPSSRDIEFMVCAGYSPISQDRLLWALSGHSVFLRLLRGLGVSYQSTGDSTLEIKSVPETTNLLYRRLLRVPAITQVEGAPSLITMGDEKALLSGLARACYDHPILMSGTPEFWKPFDSDNWSPEQAEAESEVSEASDVALYDTAEEAASPDRDQIMQFMTEPEEGLQTEIRNAIFLKAVAEKSFNVVKAVKKAIKLTAILK